MSKLKGRPDRRGMGAQSDFIAEQFVPSESYKAQQLVMVQKLLQAGTEPENVAAMFLVPFGLLSADGPLPEAQSGPAPANAPPQT